MEKTRICPNGKKINFRMTKEKGFFTNHIWIYRDGKPYLHIIPNPEDENSVLVKKNCDGYGYMSMGELFVEFDNITLESVGKL